MKFNELETEYARCANVAESAAHTTDDDAKAAAAAVRKEGNQQWNETLTDSALALALLPSMPKKWQEKAAHGRLPSFVGLWIRSMVGSPRRPTLARRVVLVAL